MQGKKPTSYVCLELRAECVSAARVELMDLGMPRISSQLTEPISERCSASQLVQQAQHLSAALMQDKAAHTLCLAFEGDSKKQATQLAAGLQAACKPLPSAHACALAELAYGAGRGLSSILWVYLGKRIVSCVADAEGIRYGVHGAAANVAHLFCPTALGRTCSCGGAAHLDCLANTTALCALYKELHGPTATVSIPSLAELDTRACNGDEIATQVEQVAGYALGQALSSALQLIDPAAIVLAGPVSRLSGPLIAQLREALSLYTDPRKAPNAVLMAELGEEAALVGAALHYKLCMQTR